MAAELKPIRNEAENIAVLARSMVAQSRPPDAWVVVDDGSTDGTDEVLRELSERSSFMRVLRTPDGYTKDVGDRHAVAAAPRAFNWALRSLQANDFTLIGKLDGDIELPEDYFARLVAEFERNPELGIAGGQLIEEIDGIERIIPIPEHHVHGALKLPERLAQILLGLGRIALWPEQAGERLPMVRSLPIQQQVREQLAWLGLEVRK